MADVHKDLDTCPSSSGGHGAGVQAKTLRYTFSKETVAEFYGRQFYSITDADNKVVAYSETVFDVPKDISLLGESKTLIFEKSLLVKGEIRGGEIWGGVIWGGVIEVSLLQIQGTRHFCYASPTKDGKEIHLGIGCEFHSIKEWLNSFGSIGNANDYSESEIEEYGEYIKLFAKRYAPELLKINE